MKPYEPTSLPLPTETLDLRRLITPAGAANAELGRYDGLLQGIVNPAIMLSPLTVEEAVLSSRLEGTQATVDDVYEHEAGIEKDAEKKHDVQEVINYRTALRLAQEYLREKPITFSFVREVHKLLLNSARGEDKSPGSFREVQNWIGRPGSPMEEALFIPPSPLKLQDHMENWLEYIKREDEDALLQTAIMHAQFEIIHPFEDGNGRIGRLLIPLFLYQKKRLSQPMFYLSAYLEKHRDEYYRYLRAISQSGDWNGWIHFFLQAVTEQAKSNIEKVNHIRELYERMKQRIQEVTRSQYSVLVLDHLFNRPIFKTTDFVKEIKMQKATAMTILRQLRKEGILHVLHSASGSRPAILAFPDLLNVAEGKKVL